MRKIKTSSVYNYIGEELGSDVIFRGFTLVPKGEILTEDLAGKISSLDNDIPFLEILDASSEVRNIGLSKFTVNELYDKVKIVMRNYSFDNLEDSEMVTEIIESTISGLSLNSDLDLDIDALLINEPDLYAHTLNTTILASLLAIKSSVFQRWMVQQIALGALLHDIGYVSLLRQYDKSSISELTLDQKREHPILGYEILENNEYIATGVKKIVLMHHYWEHPENSFDANKNIYLSYPDSYKGKKLFKEAKTLPISIVQVASSFERMVNKSQENPIVKKQAINAILKDAETIYGQGALLLANYISPYGVGDSVKLNNGKEGKVIKVTSNPMKPLLLVDGREIDLRSKPFIRIIE